MTEQYTIVMPIKIDAHTHDELRRFIDIGLRSLNKFLDVSSVHEFLIICKENESSIIQKALSEHPSPLPIRLILENQVVKQKVIGKMKGWLLQQALKLGVAKIIKTPLYLILDTDCFLTKPFAYQDLFYEGKILMDKVPWTDYSDWWLENIKIIDCIPITTLASQPTIAVTPQILVTDIICELLEYLNDKEEFLDWDEYLSTRFFTEFGLYWLFLLKTNRTYLYQSAGIGPALLSNGLWVIPYLWHAKKLTLRRRLKQIISKRYKKERETKLNQLKQGIEQIVKTAFESNTYFYFSLIQSNLPDIPVNWITEETNKYLN